MRNGVHFTNNFDFASFMAMPSVVREWHIEGLPHDNFSTENAVLATRSFSIPLCKLFEDPNKSLSDMEINRLVFILPYIFEKQL